MKPMAVRTMGRFFCSRPDRRDCAGPPTAAASARLRWRVTEDAKIVRPWHTPIDFSEALLPATAFQRIYAPGTTQNRAGHPAVLRFFLAHSWSTGAVPDGNYSLEVEASDLGGNIGTLAQAFTLANNV